MEVKNIAVLAPFTSISGYGQYGRNIASCIIKQYGNLENYKVFLFDVGGGSINEL
jgi:glycosyltransferase involved in cell wall biosynthesis